MTKDQHDQDGTAHDDHGGDDRDYADQGQRERGSTDSPLEDDLEVAFERTVGEGAQRLGRTAQVMAVTGFFGGTEVAIGVLAYIAVLHETGSLLLAGLAFSIGFLALLLGSSELFTEGFLVPVIAVVARRARPTHLFKLWGITLVSNLAGGWLIMWLVVLAFPAYESDLLKSASHFVEAGLSGETFALAVLAGAVITLMTRMQHGTEDMTGKIAAAVAMAFVLAGLQLFHSILDSLIAFGALHTGEAPFGYLDWLVWLSWTLVGNVAGGLGLVTLLRLVRSKDRIADERRAAEENSDVPS